mgnify:CR=1 FL=1
MSNITIGRIIEKLRQEKNYSRKKLSQGLCSTQMLIKIENNKSDVDKFMSDILLQRLGKSPDKLEILISKEEYRKLYMRDEIEELIWKRKKEEAEALLLEYENSYAKDNTVQKMFVLRTKAYLCQELEGDSARAEAYMRQAVELTLPGMKMENMNEYLLAAIELENILELSYLILQQGRVQEAAWILEACQKYVEKNVTDEVEYTKIFSKIAWLSSLVYIKRDEYDKAIKIGDCAFENLRKYGNLYFMMPLLEQLIQCCEKLGKDESRKKYQIYDELIKELYQQYGEEWYCQNSLFHNCCQTGYHLISEFIRQERQAKKLTQEQLIEGVYEGPENLSRIENGRVVPTRKKLDGLLKNLGVERGKYCGTLVVEDFEILESKYEIDILVGTGKYKEAQKKLSELEKRIDNEEKINKMAMSIYKMVIELGVELSTGRMHVEAIQESVRTLLEKNGVLRDGRVYRVPFFYEMAALNALGICLKRTGKRQEAIAIYQDILRCVEESAIDEKYQNLIVSPVVANLDLYDSKRKWGKKGISYELRCGKGKMLYMHFYSQVELMEEECVKREMTRKAYYLSELFYRENNRQQIKEYYEKTYGEIIE